MALPAQQGQGFLALAVVVAAQCLARLLHKMLPQGAVGLLVGSGRVLADEGCGLLRVQAALLDGAQQGQRRLFGEHGFVGRHIALGRAHRQVQKQREQGVLIALSLGDALPSLAAAARGRCSAVTVVFRVIQAVVVVVDFGQRVFQPEVVAAEGRGAQRG